MVRLVSEEGPAYGAALLAGSGAKLFPSIEKTCDMFISTRDEFMSEPEKCRIYERIYRIYKNLYPALKPSFDLMSEIS